MTNPAIKLFKCPLLFIVLLLPPSANVFAYETVVPRYALIIGNANYQYSPLKNPLNDATDMAAMLRSLRYEVTLSLDLDPVKLRQTVKQFYASIKEKNAISLFYYAGHAVQADGQNYLIPVNSQVTSYKTMLSQAFSINELFKSVNQAATKQNIVILDACRNNPFMGKKTATQGRGVAAVDIALQNLSGGLAPVKAPGGTLIAYATEPGNVASDGLGRNGAYTSALLRHISRSETAEALFKKVRKDVLTATYNRQTPWEHSSLTEKFYFIPPSNEEIPDIMNF